MTQELLELLWVMESTTAAQSELNGLLTKILAGPLFAAADLPQPTTAERRPPDNEDDNQPQIELPMK